MLIDRDMETINTRELLYCKKAAYIQIECDVSLPVKHCD